MPSEYGHTLIVRQVGGAVLVGSDRPGGRELVTAEEVYEFAMRLLIVAAEAERRVPPASEQKKKARLKRERKQLATV